MQLHQFYTQIADRLGGAVGLILRKAVARDPVFLKNVTEVRIRSGLPLAVRLTAEAFFLAPDGSCTANAAKAYRTDGEELAAALQRICQHSRYAYDQELRNGYITVPGGHRVGVAGKVIADGKITEVSSLTFRIAREIPGAAEPVFPYLVRTTADVYSTLIISPPACGKTTLIRDLARLLSDGSHSPLFAGMDVGVVDERSEIAACFQGKASNHIGNRTDVYDGCPKDRGILMLLRSMAPGVILTDELGTSSDFDAVASAMNAGVRMIATAHGYGLSDRQLRPVIREMIGQRLFERYVVLSRARGPGTLETVADDALLPVYERGCGA